MALSTEDPQVSRSHPNSFRLSDNVGNCEVFTGLFLFDFVLEGLAAHFNMTSTVCPELRVDNEPCGALAIATVAVLSESHCVVSFHILTFYRPNAHSCSG